MPGAFFEHQQQHFLLLLKYTLVFVDTRQQSNAAPLAPHSSVVQVPHSLRVEYDRNFVRVVAINP
jgi:hypothetical protein